LGAADGGVGLGGVALGASGCLGIAGLGASGCLGVAGSGAGAPGMEGIKSLSAFFQPNIELANILDGIPLQTKFLGSATLLHEVVKQRVLGSLNNLSHQILLGQLLQKTLHNQLMFL
jgi:hypothetical protein